MTVEPTPARSRTRRRLCAARAACTPARADAARRLAGRRGLRRSPAQPLRETVFDISNMSVFYGSNQALGWTSMKIYRNLVTAVIGPSGCGQIHLHPQPEPPERFDPGFRLEGQVLYHGHDIYAAATNRVEVRRRIGMVFQKPNPFPKTIYDNIAVGPAQPGPEATT